MEIGQLFINLGIKGTEKTVGALASVKEGLGSTASMSLEAKAGILAAVYAMERLVSSAGSFATGMMNFNAMTGASVDTLQRYQYAARQAGATNQDVENSFRGLQSVITKIMLGEGAPKFLARVSQLTGIQAQDLVRMQAHPEEIIQKLQEYARKERNVGFRNEALKSFGMSESMIAAMARNAFNPEALAHAPTYTNNQIKSLDKANIALQNLLFKMEMAMGKFAAGHGGALIADLDKITTAVLKLVDALSMLADKLGVFKVLDTAAAISAQQIQSITDVVQKPSAKTTENLASNFSPAYMLWKGLNSMLQSNHGLAPSPKAPALPHGNSNTTINTKVENHFNHDGKDHARTSHDFKQAVKDAWAQLPQGQGG